MWGLSNEEEEAVLLVTSLVQWLQTAASLGALHSALSQGSGICFAAWEGTGHKALGFDLQVERERIKVHLSECSEIIPLASLPHMAAAFGRQMLSNIISDCNI